MSKIKPRSRKLGTAKKQKDRKALNAQVADLKVKNHNLQLSLAHEIDMTAQAHVCCTQLQSDLAEAKKEIEKLKECLAEVQAELEEKNKLLESYHKTLSAWRSHEQALKEAK